MSNIKSVLRGWLCFMMAFLCSCSTYLSPSVHVASSAYLHKEMHLQSDMLLAESTHWNPAGHGRYWVFSFAQKRYFNNYVDIAIPTYAEYQENPTEWHQWHGSTLDGWARLVGVLSKGTAFHITDIAPRNERSGYWVTIQFDEGPYKGSTALYVNAKSLIPTLYH